MTSFSTTRSTTRPLWVALAAIATGLMFVARPSSSFTILYSFPNSSFWQDRYGGGFPQEQQQGHGHGQGQQQHQPDYYNILGVHKNASKDDVKTAFRRLVKRFHPDANPNSDTTETFQAIQMAYETLSDPTTRRQYNTRLCQSGYSSDTPHFVIDALENHCFEHDHESSRKSTSNTPAQRYYQTIQLEANENFKGSLLNNDNNFDKKKTGGGHVIRCY